MKEKIREKDLLLFGLIWSFIFLIIALYPITNGSPVLKWSLCTSVVLTLVALFMPRIFVITKIYSLWINIGNILGFINSRIIMILLFYVVFFPFGIVLKIFRKDLLEKKINKSLKTYFNDRDEQPGDMKNQY